jgi:hypothetical protein
LKGKRIKRAIVSELAIMKLLDDIPIRLKLGVVLNNLHLEGERIGKLNTQGLLKTATTLLRPKALYKAVYINNNDGQSIDLSEVSFESRVLAKNLEGVHRAFPFIITIGKQLEEKAVKHNLIEQFYLEGIGDLALRAAREYLGKYLSERYMLGKVSSMSPGQLDWPLTQQRKLFSIFGDIEEKIGVRLTENSVMIPRKSISGIVFPTEIVFTSCQLCPRKNCISRQVSYNEKLRKRYGLDQE